MKGGGYITPTTTYAEFRERPLMVAGASRPTAVGRYSSATRGRQRAASRRVASRRLAHPQPRAPGRRSVQFLCAMATALSALGPGVAAAGTNTQGDAMWPTRRAEARRGVLGVGGAARVILVTPRVQNNLPPKKKSPGGGLFRGVSTTWGTPGGQMPRHRPRAGGGGCNTARVRRTDLIWKEVK